MANPIHDDLMAIAYKDLLPKLIKDFDKYIRDTYLVELEAKLQARIDKRLEEIANEYEITLRRRSL